VRSSVLSMNVLKTFTFTKYFQVLRQKHIFPKVATSCLVFPTGLAATTACILQLRTLSECLVSEIPDNENIYLRAVNVTINIYVPTFRSRPINIWREKCIREHTVYKYLREYLRNYYGNKDASNINCVFLRYTSAKIAET
jgi:hypothetical protein